MSSDTNKKEFGNALPILEKLNGGPLTFGQMLNSHRLCRQRMTLAEMGKKLGMSAEYLSNIEHDRKNVSVETARRFAKILKERPDYFVKLALRTDMNKFIEKAPKKLRKELKQKIWGVFFPERAKAA